MNLLDTLQENAHKAWRRAIDATDEEWKWRGDEWIRTGRLHADYRERLHGSASDMLSFLFSLQAHQGQYDREELKRILAEVRGEDGS